MGGWVGEGGEGQEGTTALYCNRMGSELSLAESDTSVLNRMNPMCT